MSPLRVEVRNLSTGSLSQIIVKDGHCQTIPLFGSRQLIFQVNFLGVSIINKPSNPASPDQSLHRVNLDFLSGVYEIETSQRGQLTVLS